MIKHLALIKIMYHKRSNEELLKAGVTAALGAGVITSFAVSQGQNPFIALGITLFAAVAAVICDQLGLI